MNDYPWDLSEDDPEYQAWLEAEASAYGYMQDQKKTVDKGEKNE